MANPPYSGGVIVLVENQDGIEAKVFHWDEVLSGTPIPPLPPGLHHSLFQANPTFTAERMAATRTALKTGIGNYIDQKFPDTAA